MRELLSARRSMRELLSVPVLEEEGQSVGSSLGWATSRWTLCWGWDVGHQAPAVGSLGGQWSMDHPDPL